MEPQLHRPRPDHRGRGHRDRHRAPATTTTPARCATSIQNHMLQLLCHVAMEPPVDFTADEVRNEKVKVLRAIHRADADEDIPAMAVRAQYAAGDRRAARTSPATSRRRASRRTRTPRRYAAHAPGGRQLALGGRAVLPAHRQAPGAQGHRDRDHAQARPPPRLQRRTARSACSPTSW